MQMGGVDSVGGFNFGSPGLKHARRTEHDATSITNAAGMNLFNMNMLAVLNLSAMCIWPETHIAAAEAG